MKRFGTLYLHQRQAERGMTTYFSHVRQVGRDKVHNF